MSENIFNQTRKLQHCELPRDKLLPLPTFAFHSRYTEVSLKSDKGIISRLLLRYYCWAFCASWENFIASRFSSVHGSRNINHPMIGALATMSVVIGGVFLENCVIGKLRLKTENTGSAWPRLLSLDSSSSDDNNLFSSWLNCPRR